MNKKILKIVKNNYRKFKTNAYFKAKFIYTEYYEKLSVDENIVFFQSYGADSVYGNPFYILRELCRNPEYKNFKIYVAAREQTEESIQAIFEKNGWSGIKTVIFSSDEYCKILATAKYLINNAALPSYFIKKDEQIYLNTWHGTPLKTLGRQMRSAPNEIGNSQRNMIMSDYLLYPNKFTFDVMRRDYMLDNFYKGKYIVSGYPRNEAFFDEESRQRIRQENDLEGKKVIVFMPTWKGSLNNKNNDEQIVYTKHAIYEMEEHLDEDTVIFVKLHYLVSKSLDFSGFKKTKQFPEGYETYEFLNAADCLVTDYSSVFWDFANTGRKIVLYAYDYDKYIRERGMYIDMTKLPFPIAYNSSQLIEELKNLNEYTPYKKAMGPFIGYDSKDAAKIICDYIFKGQKHDKMDIYEGEEFSNGKESVLVFSGALLKNGITTSLKNLMNSVSEGDKTDKNYVLTFYQKRVEANKESIFDFPDDDYIVIQSAKSLTVFEAFIQFLYLRLNIKTKYILKRIKKMNEREVKRLYPGIQFSYCIHFSGYEPGFFNIMQGFKACKKLVWVHNNMYAEGAQKGNFHKESLKQAYAEAHKIAVVRESLKDELLPFVKKGEEDKLVVVHNVNDINGTREKAALPVEFNEDTYCNITAEELSAILESDCEKFINIARFSKEKGLDRLITAFSEYRKENPEAYLIIIGGYGKEFSAINTLAEELGEGHIVVIKSIRNPYPILAKCDEFILSSYYEGLPMTIIEALILGVPVVSTNIPGPREFLEKGYGKLVEDSDEGVLRAFKMLKSGEIVPDMQFNAEEFNNNALNEFYSLFD